MYLSPNDDYQSSITFGGQDDLILSESKDQYGGDPPSIKINNDRKWQVDLRGIKIGDEEVYGTAQSI